MKIKLIKFEGYTGAPVRAHYNDAGADVHIGENVVLQPGTVTRVPLGFGLEIPDGLAGFIFPRSSLAYDGIICQIPPIDSGYRGEISALIYNCTGYARRIDAGDRIGQLVILSVVYADFVTKLGPNRGDGAFGSTGE